MSLRQVRSCLFYAGLHFILSIVLICIHYFTWLGSRVGMTTDISVILLTWILRILMFPVNIVVILLQSQFHESGLYMMLFPLSSLFWGWIIFQWNQIKHDSFFQYKSSTGVHV